MPWMPSPSRKREIGWLNSISRYGTKPNAIVLHITASNAASQYAYFSAIRFAGSHFHVARDGTIEQYAGTGARSAADRSSRRTISIETQGAWGPWTDAQVRSLAEIVVWIHKTHGIPLRLMTSSKTSQAGIGWHRLGVKGNFASGLLGGVLQRGGGEVWSGSVGKACPTDPCIRQVDDVLRLAKELNGRDGGASRGDDRAPVASKRQPKRLPTVRLGNRGRDVKLLQNALLERGYKVGTADGVFGDLTLAGVKEFQKGAGIDVDGVAGPDTWFSLCQGAGKGAGKYRNKVAQRVAGIPAVNGLPGSRFVARWKAIQRWLGVAADGVIGTHTTNALVKKG